MSIRRSEDVVASEHSTDSEGNCKMSISIPNNKHTSMTKTSRELRPRFSSKILVKPIIHLTYDEPGKARDQPIDIFHKVIINKLG